MTARKRKQESEKLPITPHTTLNYDSTVMWLKANHWRIQESIWAPYANGVLKGKAGHIEWWNRGANFLLVYVFGSEATVCIPMKNRAATRVIGKRVEERDKPRQHRYTIHYKDGVEQEVFAYNSTDAAAQATHGAAMVKVVAHDV